MAIINKEQGGSVLNIGSTGSLVIASGAKLNLSSDLALASGGSLTIAAGGGFSIGNVGIETGKNAPTHSASPGAVYFRSDGSVSNMYINISSGTTGSVWRSACIVN